MPVRGEELNIDKGVGFILAMLFGFVIGLSLWAVLAGDYVQPGSVMNEQTHRTVRIVGFAGGLAALIAWWMQGFAANRGFLVRMLFALFIFVVAFCSLGGFFRVAYLMITYPNQIDWSPSGLYWTSQSDLISFVLFLLVPPRPAYAALILGAAVYIAIFRPRGPRTVEA